MQDAMKQYGKEFFCTAFIIMDSVRETVLPDQQKTAEKSGQYDENEKKREMLLTNGKRENII